MWLLFDQLETDMPKPRRPELNETCKSVDLNVYNDSNVFAIYTEPSDKRAPAIQSEKDAVVRELGLVLPLSQDDSYVLRIRLGPPSAVEKREFVGCSSGHLDLSSGILMSGESSLRVPKKRFRVEVRSFFPHNMCAGNWQRQMNDQRSSGLIIVERVQKKSFRNGCDGFVGVNRTMIPDMRHNGGV